MQNRIRNSFISITILYDIRKLKIEPYRISLFPAFPYSFLFTRWILVSFLLDLQFFRYIFLFLERIRILDFKEDAHHISWNISIKNIWIEYEIFIEIFFFFSLSLRYIPFLRYGKYMKSILCFFFNFIKKNIIVWCFGNLLFKKSGLLTKNIDKIWFLGNTP